MRNKLRHKAQGHDKPAVVLGEVNNEIEAFPILKLLSLIKLNLKIFPT